VIAIDRAVRFEEVDAAGIVFFAHFYAYCHEAMERLFDGVPGGYVGLITKRKIGFPAVHTEADFKAPLRYGDTARIEAGIAKLGETSCNMRYRVVRARDAVLAATIEHVTVASDLVQMTKLRLPDDVRAALAPHLLA